MSGTSLSPRQQPFLFLTCSLCAGIIVDRTVRPPAAASIAFALLAQALAVRFNLHRRPVLATVCLLGCIAAAGDLASLSDRASTPPSQLKALFENRIIGPDDAVELTGMLAQMPEPAPGEYFLDLDVQTLSVGKEIRTASGHVRLSISSVDSDAAAEFATLHLDYGSKIRVLARLQRATVYHNPGSPDFNEFLERRGFDLKGIVKSPLLIEEIGREPVNRLLRGLFHLRLWMIEALDRNFESRVAGTLKAMLTGNRYYLDAQVEQRLREGATFHVLVISGLHVGFIAFLLLASTGGRQISHLRAFGWASFRVAIALTALWAYAVMVGLAAPVTRAATMLSIGLTGPLLFRQSVSINTLSMAAFIMLVLKPALIADPGFQLSFAAVFGIVSLALPVIRELQRIGRWRPTPATPHPPTCSRMIRLMAEAVFWDERRFATLQMQSSIAYRPFKSPVASILSRLRIQAVVRAGVLLVVTSSSIQLTTLPLMAYYFNRAAPVGVLLNIFAGLLTFTLMSGSLGVLIISYVSDSLHWSACEPLAEALTWIVSKAHALLVNAVDPFVNLPGGSFRVAHYDGAEAAIYFLYAIPLSALALGLARWSAIRTRLPLELNGPRRRLGPAAAAGEPATIPISNSAGRSANPDRTMWNSMRTVATLIVAVAIVIWPPSAPASGKLTVHFLDVGQGDSALVVFPGGATLLVDGGGEIAFGEVGSRPPPPLSAPAEPGEEAEMEGTSVRDSVFRVGEAVVSRFLWSQHRTQLDYILATHSDADHIGGLSDVARNFRIGEALVGHVPIDNAEFLKFRRSVELERIPLAMLESGQQFEIQGVSVQVLWPRRGRGPFVTSGNNDSVVLRLVYGSIAILLAGDIEQPAEEELIRSGLDLRSDVLKVPHHGSKTSSSEAFLDAVLPRCAVVSVGEHSRFGHPHAVVLDRYLKRNVRLFQTGKDGTITLETDGGTLDVRTFAHH